MQLLGQSRLQYMSMSFDYMSLKKFDLIRPVVAHKLIGDMQKSVEERLNLRIANITDLTRSVKSFELTNELGGGLPSFDAGAHVEVTLPPSLKRHYSICNDSTERHRYVIAVLRQDNGAGGSKYMHEKLRVGDRIEASMPRNNFPLVGGPKRFILIAGGIGITPILPMISELQARNGEFALHYCAKSRDEAAFVDLLEARCNANQLATHFDGGDPSKGLNVSLLLSEYHVGTHVYCCGPSGLMQAVRAATVAWPDDAVHFEYFAPMDAGNTGSDAEAFDVIIRSRSLSLKVPPDKTIVQVLRENGIEVETSCEAGTCGTCRCRYLAGQPIHNDYVLTTREKGKYVMICCARARGEPLILDL